MNYSLQNNMCISFSILLLQIPYNHRATIHGQALSRCVHYISHHYKPGTTLAANYESYTPMHLKIPTGVTLFLKVQPCTLISHVAKENISMLLFKAVFLNTSLTIAVRISVIRKQDQPSMVF